MIIKNFLKDEDFFKITKILSNKKEWSSGPLTGNQTDKNFKQNKEYIGDQKYLLDEILINALTSNIEWRQYVVAPKNSSSLLWLKYEKNSLYRYHADVSKGTVGSLHYTNTLFLSDPLDYSGGELVLTINNEEIPYKLSKNTLLTYPVGLKHYVNPVTEGERLVFVCWTESWISSNEDRSTLRELGYLYENINKITSDLFDFKESVARNPYSEIMIDLTRMSEYIHNKYPRFRDPLCQLITE